jgi:hypothetical protein
VQDAFIAMHANWRRLNKRASAAWYLRQCVMNRSRSVLRHRRVAERRAPQPLPDMPSAEEAAFERMERSAVIAALLRLAPRQREALVLRYYADLSGTQIAAAMGDQRGRRQEPHQPGPVGAARPAHVTGISRRDGGHQGVVRSPRPRHQRCDAARRRAAHPGEAPGAQLVSSACARPRLRGPVRRAGEPGRATDPPLAKHRTRRQCRSAPTTTR